MTLPTPLLRGAIVTGLLSLLLLLPNNIMMNMGDGVVVVAFSSSGCFSVKKQHPPWGAGDIVSPRASSTVRATLLLGSTRILSKRNRHHPLYSSRGGQRTTDDYYYEEDDEEDDDISDSLSYPRPRSDKSSKMNRVTPRKRRDIRVDDTNEVDDFEEEEMEDEFPLDDDDEEIDDDSGDFMEDREDRRISSTRRSSRRRSRTDYDDDNEDYWDDDDEYFDDGDMDTAASAGNFWSNPKDSLDRPPRDLRRPRLADIPQRRERVQREYDGRPDYYVNDSRRTPRRGPAWRSPVRVGAPPPNQFLEQLYDKVFFYGFDLDENDDRNVGDKSVFGGTKGKFNGLKYLAISEGRDPSIYSKRRQRDPKGARPGRRLPPSRSGEIEEDYYEDDYLSERSYPSPEARSRYSRRVERGRRSSGRVDRPREEGFMDSFGFANGRGRNDRVSKQVSTWFTDEDGDDGFDLDDDEYDEGSMESSSRSGRRGRRQQSEWSPVGMLESFLRIDRDQMDFKAAEYDSKMGIRRPRSRRTRGSTGRPGTEKSAQEKVQRPGYAYRYDASLDDDDSPTVLDIDATVDIEEESEADQKIGAEPTAEGEPDKAPRKKSDKSWEERQAAVERVPPADVPAWGPKGQLPINARQKAIEDALKDIQLAKRKLNDRVKKEIRARDEIAILNVDSKALRLKMDQSRRGRSSQLDVEQLRQIELEIDDASRALRRSRKRVDIAREELEELEDRHYAVLSYYDPDQASKLVGDALDELSGQVGSSASGTLEPNES